MAMYRVAEKTLEPVPETTFASEKLLERRDLQRLLRSDISVIAPDLMVIAEEFGEWEDSSRRIDLLCLDQQQQLVVVELKRSEDGGHMELQALRYAAMISSLTYDQLVDAHARFRGEPSNREGAAKAILDFLNVASGDDIDLGDEVRIILVSADFSVEITTTVLWLNKHDVDITCVRLKPYRLEGQLLVDIQQLIPLPEAEQYEIKIREKSREKSRNRSARHDIMRRFWAQLIERSKSRTGMLANRSATPRHWLSGRIGRSGLA